MRKIDFKKFSKSAGKIIRNNASTGCTILGIAGVLATAYFAIKEAKASEKKERHAEPETIPEKIGDAVATYPKTIVTATASIGFIAASRIIDSKDIAGLAALASAEIARNRKIREKIPPEQMKEINKEIIEEQLFAPDDTVAIRTGHGDTLCYEEHIGHFFYSSKTYIEQAALELNRTAFDNRDIRIELDDFYREIGLPSNTRYGIEHGFEYDPNDSCSGIQLRFNTDCTASGIPYLIIEYVNEPIEI